MTDTLISLVLPVYNQQDHIMPVVEEYEQALERARLRHETLLVVNASRDRSLEVCQELAGRYSAVRVLHSDQGGWGRAVRLGLHEAQGSLVCYTNSARTSAPDLLLMLVYATAYPKVVVKANRKIREGWRRRLGSLLYNLECRALFDLSYWDINGTPKVFPREFGALLDLRRVDDLIDLEFMALCRQQSYPVVEVPIFSSSRRASGESTTSYGSALRMYLGAWRMRRHLREGSTVVHS